MTADGLIYHTIRVAREKWEARASYIRPGEVVRELGCSRNEAVLALKLGVEYGQLGKRDDGRYYWKVNV